MLSKHFPIPHEDSTHNISHQLKPFNLLGPIDEPTDFSVVSSISNNFSLPIP